MKKSGIRERFEFYKKTGKLPYKNGRIDEDLMYEDVELSDATNINKLVVESPFNKKEWEREVIRRNAQSVKNPQLYADNRTSWEKTRDQMSAKTNAERELYIKNQETFGKVAASLPLMASPSTYVGMALGNDGTGTGSIIGDIALDTALLGLPSATKGVTKWVGKQIASRSLGKPIVPKDYSGLQPKIRTKVGDVEINNPSLFYRQGPTDMGDDFLNTGVVGAGTEFDNPMFARGHLWYGLGDATKKPMAKTPKTPGRFSLDKDRVDKPKPDLIVSNADMVPANAHSHRISEIMTKEQTHPYAKRDYEDLPLFKDIMDEWNKAYYANEIPLKVPVTQVNKELVRAVPKERNGATTANSVLYRYEPNYGYKRMSSVESPNMISWKDAVRTPQITAKNAASITPAQWTSAQDAAIARGDVAEAQRLRDLHFITYQHGDMIDVNGNPIHVYHGSPEENIIEFYKPNDPRLPIPKGINVKATGEEGIYTSPKKGYAAHYMEDLGGRYRIPPTKEQKALLKAGKTREEIGLPSTPKGRLYDLYSNTKLVPENLEIDFNPFTLSTEEANLIKSKGYSGFDIPGKKYPEHVVLEPNQLKLADAVTYDNNGVRIPLGKRDNFKIKDLRYGLIPLLLTSAAYNYHNQ